MLSSRFVLRSMQRYQSLCRNLQFGILWYQKGKQKILLFKNGIFPEKEAEAL